MASLIGCVNEKSGGLTAGTPPTIGATLSHTAVVGLLPKGRDTITCRSGRTVGSPGS